MQRMNTGKRLVLWAALAIGAANALPAGANDPPAEKPKAPFSSGAATLPRLTLLCKEFEIADEREATGTAVLRDATEMWSRIASLHGVLESSALFVAGAPPRDKETAFPLRLSLCGIVTDPKPRICIVDRAASAATPKALLEPCLVAREVDPTEGTIGYCEESDASTCLKAAAKTLGATDDTPWKRLPIYAPWTREARPVDAGEAVAFLHTARSKVNEDRRADGKGVSFPRKISFKVCPAGIECPVGKEPPKEATTPQQLAQSLSKGIVWFVQSER